MRNSNTLKVLIFTRNISNNPGKLTLYARITVNGKSAEISLKRYVSVKEWDENKADSMDLPTRPLWSLSSIIANHKRVSFGREP